MFIPMLCAKQIVIAIIVKGNQFWFGYNECNNPQLKCPRKGLPTGQGYELCKSVCGQESHAEIQAIKHAGKNASGGVMYLIGHTYCCDDCLKEIKSALIKDVIICNKDITPIKKLIDSHLDDTIDDKHTYRV